VKSATAAAAAKETAMTIEFKFVPTNVITRWPCDICGGWTDKDEILIEADAPDGSTLRVCPLCLKGDVEETLKERAEQIEADAPHAAARMIAYAQELRSLIGQIKVPTFAEWEAETKNHYNEWLANLPPDERAEEEAYRASVAAPMPQDNKANVKAG
jgi:hypothetical protein